MNSNFRVLFIYPNQAFLNPPPIAIGLLNAMLHEQGFKTAVFDNTFYETKDLTSDKTKEENLQVKPFNFSERGIFPEKTDVYEDLKRKVESFKPDLIALSVLEGTYPYALNMLEAIKDYKAPVLVGGVFAIMAPEIVINHPRVSFVCIGEGERTLVKLAKALAAGKDYTDIENLWIKNKGEIIKNALSEPLNLDSLPLPDYSIFEKKRFYRPMAGYVWRIVPIETNRGCPYGCTFCNSPSIAQVYRARHLGNYFRKKSISRIYQELKFLVNTWQAEYIYFSSDTFLAMSDREFDEFIEIYSEFKLPFWMQSRPETITFERMRKLKNLGCHRMSMGLEHGNEEFRRRILKKPFKNDIFLKATNAVYQAGIPLTVNNIIGFPHETRELIFDTIKLNRQVKFDSCNAYCFYPFRGTSLYDLCKREGFLSQEDTSSGCLTKGSRLNMPQLANEEIRGLMRTFVLYVKMPESLWPEIKIAERFNQQGNKKFQELKEIYFKKYN